MTSIRIPMAALTVLTIGLATAVGGEPSWKKHTINAKSAFEAAGAFDVDNDGKLELLGKDWLGLRAILARANGDEVSRLEIKFYGCPC